MNIEITNNPFQILIDGKLRKCGLRKKDGYVQIRVKKKMFLVHRLLALNFIANPFNLPQVNHKNGIKTDNRLENLEWVSASDNIKHAYRKFGVEPREQKKTISIEEAQIIREKYSTGKFTMLQLAKEYGFNNRQMIWNIIKNKTYKSQSPC